VNGGLRPAGECGKMGGEFRWGGGPRPRPQSQNAPERLDGMSVGGWDVKFRVKDGVLTVLSLAETEHQ